MKIDDNSILELNCEFGAESQLQCCKIVKVDLYAHLFAPEENLQLWRENEKTTSFCFLFS